MGQRPKLRLMVVLYEKKKRKKNKISCGWAKQDGVDPPQGERPKFICG